MPRRKQEQPKRLPSPERSQGKVVCPTLPQTSNNKGSQSAATARSRNISGRQMHCCRQTGKGEREGEDIRQRSPGPGLEPGRALRGL
ncbi:hypothetical protein AMECASPLE_003768 [Ameca splendens]|uniref:Uncharacterized protein n=1 Tax=Ameca splendens TaxID=208324 RepID=A0ABV0Y9L3_9TELE